jgi:hypothetical protein
VIRNERKEFEKKMKQILKHINETGELPELDDFSKRCLYHCVEEKHFIDGIHGQKMISGRIVFDISSDRLALNKAGLDFCWKPIPWEFGANVFLAVVTAISVLVAIFK